MSSLMTSLGIDRLSLDDRVRLVEELLDSLGADREPHDLTEAQRSELDRRLAALDAAPTSLRSWQEVEANVLGTIRSRAEPLA
jgi:putative addiction module component (TIGR02574 family)